MSELFPRCPDCGSICWNNAGEYICSDPACKNFDKIVEPVLYNVRRKKNENNTGNNNRS